MRQQMDRKHTHRHHDDVVEEEHSVTPSTSDSSLAEEIDDLLDEIDSVLEQNAEEFVKSYVQKGGE